MVRSAAVSSVLGPARRPRGGLPGRRSPRSPPGSRSAPAGASEISRSAARGGIRSRRFLIGRAAPPRQCRSDLEGGAHTLGDPVQKSPAPLALLAEPQVGPDRRRTVAGHQGIGHRPGAPLRRGRGQLIDLGGVPPHPGSAPRASFSSSRSRRCWRSPTWRISARAASGSSSTPTSAERARTHLGSSQLLTLLGADVTEARRTSSCRRPRAGSSSRRRRRQSCPARGPPWRPPGRPGPCPSSARRRRPRRTAGRARGSWRRAPSPRRRPCMPPPRTAPVPRSHSPPQPARAAWSAAPQLTVVIAMDQVGGLEARPGQPSLLWAPLSRPGPGPTYGAAARAAGRVRARGPETPHMTQARAAACSSARAAASSGLLAGSTPSIAHVS